MKTFQHCTARSIRQATSLLAKHRGKARVNAGGSDLLGDLKDGCVAEYPEILINIKTIPDLEYIKAGSKGLKIGALTRLADIVKSPLVKKEYPLLAEAAVSIASPNIRNVATIGGNLAQDVRCWYYRYPQQIGGPITCLRKGGKICNALVGDNRYHSIFGAAAASDRRCATHCPANIDIPAYLRLIRGNDMAQAASILLRSNPFPAITGRVCPIFCESHCNRSEYDEPVAIHSIERGVGDYVLEHPDEFFAPPGSESGKKISVIGSGPAGLAAAYYLRKNGYGVKVLEKLPEAGGMLRYSIPPYRLPKEIVDKQLRALKNMGIQIQTAAVLDVEAAARIVAESDAVFVAGGTWRDLKLGVPGEDAAGVWSALNYLKRINEGERIPLGRSVIVIGGGSVAVDAARTARRTGADEVHIVCLETRDLASKDRMPALDQEILEAEEEGIVIHPSLGVRAIRVANGVVGGIETKRCISVRQADGRFDPKYDESAELPALQGESVIVAIGQAAEEPAFAPGGKVFVGGDMAEGPSTVIQAIASAKRAVNAIEGLLGIPQPEPVADERRAEYSESHFDGIPRANAGEIPAPERIRDIHVEDMKGLSEAEWTKEAFRCVSCGCLAVGPSDIAVALVALNARIVTTKRTLPAQAFFTATASSSNVLEQDELVKEIQIPKAPRGTQQRYLKFTLRKPIDFAIVSVASVISSKDGACSDARIVLGAVAPSPLRVAGAEAALKGRAINGESAAQAAKAALDAVQPLSMNRYKVNVARALIQRSILGLPE